MKIKYLLLYVFIAFIGLSACNYQPETTKNEEKLAAYNDSIYSIYLMQGREITSASFKTLSTNLMKAIQEGGPTNALQYCNLQAVPLVDSLMKVYGAEIKRITSKERNPANKANALELEMLAHFENAIKQSGLANDTVWIGSNDDFVYMSPILMAAPCLQCHGVQGKEVAEKTFLMINELYPEDKAMGYALGDLRGMWHIRFNDSILLNQGK